jgi:ABC-type branched-subunit amino acid transport system permease subunit
VDYFYFIIAVIGIWVIMSLSANLVLGYAGQFTIGHVGYLAIGAYTTGILNIFTGMNFFATLPIAIVVTALVALLTLIPLLRLGPLHFGLATLGLNVVIVDLIHNLAPRVQGAEGLFGLTMPAVMVSGPGRCAIVVLLTALCVWVSRILVTSPFGRTLRALRDRPDALQSLGKDVDYYRILVWTISGALAGLAGGLYTATLSYIDPTVFVVLFSFNLLVYIGVGGLASILGSVLGATLLIAFGEALRFGGLPSDISGPVQQALFGLLLVVIMMFRRQGLVGQYEFHD